MALSFNGSSDSLFIASGLGLTASPFTIACRYTVDNITANMVCVDVYNSSTLDEIYMQFDGVSANDPARFVVVDVGNNSDTMTLNSTVTTAAVFLHSGRAASNTVRALTIDNANVNGSGVSLNPTGFNSIYIGRYRTGVYHDGDIAEFAFWSASLLDAELESLRKGFPAKRVRPQSLLANLRMIRDAQDLKGNVWTVSGTAATAHFRSYG